MMRRKWIIVGLVALIVVVVVVAAYARRPLSDAEIKQKFDCDRVTEEWRTTDVYCQNPALYREHVKSGRDIAVVQPGQGVAVCGDANYAAVAKGMSRAEITTLLGEPDRKLIKTSKEQNWFAQGADEMSIKEGWVYTAQNQDANVEIHFDYDGRVVSKGCGNG